MSAPTPSLRDAAQMALDALEMAHDAYAAWGNGTARIDAAIAALRASLALPDAEPVAIIAVTPNGGASIGWMPGYIATHNDKLYAAPQPAHVERQPLTRHEIHSLLDCAGVKAFGVKFEHEMQVARAVEDAHGIGPASKG